MKERFVTMPLKSISGKIVGSYFSQSLNAWARFFLEQLCKLGLMEQGLMEKEMMDLKSTYYTVIHKS